jgi:hypothetical protein
MGELADLPQREEAARASGINGRRESSARGKAGEVARRGASLRERLAGTYFDRRQMRGTSRAVQPIRSLAWL